MIEDTSLVIPLNVSGDSANDKVEIFTSEVNAEWRGWRGWKEGQGWGEGQG